MHTAALSRSRLGHWGWIGQKWDNVDSGSIHVCTFTKRNKTKEENSRLHSQLSLSSLSSLLITLFYMFGWPQPFQSHMETNLCGVANAEQRDKKSNRYLWLLMDLVLGIGNLYIQGQGWLWGRDFGGYSQKVDTVESFITPFFSHPIGWHNYFYWRS